MIYSRMFSFEFSIYTVVLILWCLLLFTSTRINSEARPVPVWGWMYLQVCWGPWQEDLGDTVQKTTCRK